MSDAWVTFLAGMAVGAVAIGAPAGILLAALCRAAAEGDEREQAMVYRIDIELPARRDEGARLLDEIADGYELARMAEASVHGEAGTPRGGA